MKIPLPAGNFIYFGKQNKEIKLTKKSADLVRDEQGAVTGSVPSYSLESVEKYVDIVFSPNTFLQNFVFLFENIAEIQFPINYITSRIKNGNKEFIQQAFIYKYLVGDSFIYAPTLPLSSNLWDICENFWVLPSHLVSIDSKTEVFFCIRAEPRKPAKRNADVMQGVKERPTEAPFTTMQPTLCRCGLEGGDRPFGWR